MFADGSAVGVVVDLSSFTINYNLRVDKVIGQCNDSFQELNKTKEDFQKKIEEFRKEAEEMKKELDNKTRTFEETRNEWKTQLDEKTGNGHDDSKTYSQFLVIVDNYKLYNSYSSYAAKLKYMEEGLVRRFLVACTL